MTAAFSVTANQVITAAMFTGGALADGESPTVGELARGLEGLQILLKAWADKGYKGWLYGTQSFAFVASREYWTLGETGANVTMVRPERIAQAWWEDTATPANRTPLNPLSRNNFNNLTPKLQTSLPNSWYYDPQIPNGRFYIWPLCINTSGTLGFSYQRPISDLSGGTGTFDVPQQWYHALKWNLAYECMTDWGFDERIMRRIEARAPIILAEAANYTEEDASVIFQPNPQGGYWNGYGR